MDGTIERFCDMFYAKDDECISEHESEPLPGPAGSPAGGWTWFETEEERRSRMVQKIRRGRMFARRQKLCPLSSVWNRGGAGGTCNRRALYFAADGTTAKCAQRAGFHHSRQPPDRAQNKDNAAIDKLLENLPEGTVLPPSPGRGAVRIPNLKSTNPSFAARLVIHVRDRFGGGAPAVYRAAHVSRKTYSSIVGNELRPVSKQTALAFAHALRLPLKETGELLESAGFSLSRFYLEDRIIKACIIAGIHDIDRVNAILAAHNAKTFAYE